MEVTKVKLGTINDIFLKFSLMIAYNFRDLRGQKGCFQSNYLGWLIPAYLL